MIPIILSLFLTSGIAEEIEATNQTEITTSECGKGAIAIDGKCTQKPRNAIVQFCTSPIQDISWEPEYNALGTFQGPEKWEPITEQYTKKMLKAEKKEAFKMGWKAAKGVDKSEWKKGSIIGITALPAGAIGMVTLGMATIIVVPLEAGCQWTYILSPIPIPERDTLENKTMENAWRRGYRSHKRIQKMLISNGVGITAGVAGVGIGIIGIAMLLP